MEQIGFSVVDAEGNEVQHWGDAPGAIVGPDRGRVVWPDGAMTEAISAPFEHGQWKFVNRMYAWGTPAPAMFDGEKVVVTGALSDLKDKLKTMVDDDAERIRLKYITPGQGMAMTYQEKHRQAEAVDDLGEEAANALSESERNTQFPTLSASVGIEASTLWDCAQLVIERYELFGDLSHQIEKARLQGKKNIGDASDAASAKAAYEAITWPV